MRLGKVQESILKRSILKQITYKRDEVILGPAVGEDCAAIEIAEGEVLILTQNPVIASIEEFGTLTVQRIINNLYTSGAVPIGIMITLLLPYDSDEIIIKKIMKSLQEECIGEQLVILGGHTELTAGVNWPIISATGVGSVKKQSFLKTGNVKPGQEIIMSKWVGIYGTALLAKEKEKELMERYAGDFLEGAKAFSNYQSIVKEAIIGKACHVSAMHDITTGGIFGALWEMASASGVGLFIDQSKIPMKQETVEICEFYDLNPYLLHSMGSLLMASDRGSDVVNALKKEGIEATVIGKAVEGNEKIIFHEDERRFLEPPKRDELYKVLSM